mmetsp:Transcript_3944/g.8793  ORF Transcript_3944/g.8793 Transcript_3944/m.8793 type:complete len:174 (+) Transcript_3944:1031-1552(+)
MEDKESLETGAVVGQFTDPVEDKVHDFLPDGVVTAGVVVGGIFLSADDLLGVVQLAVGSGAHLVTHSWFEININSTRDVFTSTSFAEEGVEGVIATSDGLVTWHLTVGLDSVLEAVEFPAAVTGLDTGLAQVDRDTFTHGWEGNGDDKMGTRNISTLLLDLDELALATREVVK